jgi:hypothetical protein
MAWRIQVRCASETRLLDGGEVVEIGQVDRIAPIGRAGVKNTRMI